MGFLLLSLGMQIACTEMQAPCTHTHTHTLQARFAQLLARTHHNSQSNQRDVSTVEREKGEKKMSYKGHTNIQSRLALCQHAKLDTTTWVYTW